MDMQAYIQWFEQKTDIVSRFDEDGSTFLAMYSDGLWKVGYAYIEDFEGDYFYRNIVGEGHTFLEALADCFKRTMPLIDVMEGIENLPKPIHFPKGNQYTRVYLGMNGNLVFRDVVYEKAIGHGRHRFSYQVGDRNHSLAIRVLDSIYEKFDWGWTVHYKGVTHEQTE